MRNNRALRVFLQKGHVRAIGCVQDGGWGVHLEGGCGKLRHCKIDGGKVGAGGLYDFLPHNKEEDPRQTRILSVAIGRFLAHLIRQKLRSGASEAPRI
jgi:hypothetical protein